MSVNSFNAQNPPLTTKGDLFTFSTIPTRLGVGANDTVLTADSAEATGLKWATPSAGGMTLISTTSLTGATVTLSSIPQTYKMIRLIVKDYYHSQGVGNTRQLGFTVNSTASIYRSDNSSSAPSSNAITGANAVIANSVEGAAFDNLSVVDLYEYASTSTVKYADTKYFNLSDSVNSNYFYGNLRNAIRTTSAITSISLAYDAFNHQAGTVELWGIN